MYNSPMLFSSQNKKIFDNKHSQVSTISECEKKHLRARVIEAHKEFSKAVAFGNKEILQSQNKFSRNVISSPLHSNYLKKYKRRKKYFIDGNKLNPENITPELVPVGHSTLENDLFSLTRHTWSLPFSKGYGRRIRFLVMDTHHESVIGIIGMQSPPADLACRDNMFNFPNKKKLDLVNQTMDVFSLGALPPYSNLLGGKLVAGLVAANEIRNAYWRKYASKHTEIDGKLISQPLVAATTTSAYGRSSIYNRLKHEQRLLAEPIGYTKGCGTIHLEPLYPELCDLVEAHGLNIKGGYGNGPRIRWQVISRAFSILGISNKYFQHGLQRQVFLYRFTNNLESGMSGGSFGTPINMKSQDYINYWHNRWLIPRSRRNNEWPTFSSLNYFQQRFNQ